MGQFVLHVKDLEEGLTTHRFDLHRDWLSSGLEGVEGIEAGDASGVAEIDATRRGSEVLVRGTVCVGLSVDCVRCLGAFTLDVTADVEALMLPGRPVTDASKGDDEEDDELGVERYQGEKIVLDELLRDAILLEVPMNPNCGDDCKGWDHLQDR